MGWPATEPIAQFPRTSAVPGGIGTLEPLGGALMRTDRLWPVDGIVWELGPGPAKSAAAVRRTSAAPRMRPVLIAARDHPSRWWDSVVRRRTDAPPGLYQVRVARCNEEFEVRTPAGTPNLAA